MGTVHVAERDDDNARHGNEHDLRDGQAERWRHQAAAAPARVAIQEVRGGGHHDHNEQDPADDRGELSPEQVVENRLVVVQGVADADGATVQDDDRRALEDEQAAKRDDEGRHLEPGDQGSLDGADRRADQKRHDDRHPPWKGEAVGTERAACRGAGLDQLGHDDGAEPHDQTDGQVDLAEEEGEDLGHRQQHVDAALLEEVDEVLGRQKLPVGELEGDRDHHDAKKDRQHTAVAALDLLQRAADIAPE